MKHFIAVVGFLLVAFIAPAQSVSAATLQIAPLEYRTKLEKGEVKKGYVDINNPTDKKVKVATEVQAFRQINNDGGLQFYDDKLISKGIKPELEAFVLGPREAIRLYFTINGNKLPSGDVYAALFTKTQPAKPTNGVGQQVRVGTILSIINKTPGSRDAEIVAVNASPFQLGSTVQGTYSIKNTAPKNTSSGFYPTSRIDVWPGQSFEHEGSLIFSGITRENSFTYSDIAPGIHKVTVSYGNSAASQWVVVVPAWLLLIGGAVVLIIAIEVILWRRRIRKHRTKASIKKKKINITDGN